MSATPGEDARYAQVLSFPNARELRRRLPPLVVGLFVLGFAISVSVRAQLGVSPWDVFHQGIAETTGLAVRIPMLLAAVVMFGIGGGLYIGSGLGPGPRDGLMTAIAGRGHSIWVVRTVLECSALVAGYVLGGHVGVGTLLLAFTIGPVTHAGLRRFHLPVRDEAPEVLGE